MREGTVVAVDPGYKQTAVVVWDGERVLWSEIVSNLELLPILDSLAKSHGNVAIERMQCYGKPAGKEVLETCEWIGRMVETCVRAGAEVIFIYRMQAKMHLCQSSRARDSHIRQALIDKHGAPGTGRNPGPTYGLKADLWAALAIADTWKTASSP